MWQSGVPQVLILLAFPAAIGAIDVYLWRLHRGVTISEVIRRDSRWASFTSFVLGSLWGGLIVHFYFAAY